MLSWVNAAEGDIRRIGFAMGEAGEFSRILTLACGGPITYATFDAPVAPGQIPIDLLLDRYHAQSISGETGIIGVIGSASDRDMRVEALNRELGNESGSIAIPLPDSAEDQIEMLTGFLKIDEVIQV